VLKFKNSRSRNRDEAGCFRIVYDDVQFGGYVCAASGAYISGYDLL